jgi:hypothetical protein
MRSAADILREFGLPTDLSAKGRHYSTCPKCSRERSREHQKSKCLGITVDDDGVQFGCNHCGWKGGAYFNGKTNGKAYDPIIATYEYTDESGTVLFRKPKTAAKNYWQERPDGRGGWIKGLGDVERVLYRLPELIEAIASERTIIIPEGEKDVESLRRIGVPATCNPEGASEPGKKPKWKAKYSERLLGADIIIIPDHDPAGYAHAEAVAAMSTGIAKSVRVLKLAEHWPQCPEHGDISDWLEAGHTSEQFDDLITRAKPWKPTEQPNGNLIQSNAEFIKRFVPPDYLFDGIIQRRFLYALTAPTNAGKTAVGLRLAVHVITGWPLVKLTVEQGKVLFLAGENPDDVRMRWIKQCEDLGIGWAVENMFWIAGRLSISQMRQRIDQETEKHGPFSLIVIDSAAAFFEGDDENSNAQYGAYARMLRTLVKISGGPTILVLCHPIKNTIWIICCRVAAARS